MVNAAPSIEALGVTKALWLSTSGIQQAWILEETQYPRGKGYTFNVTCDCHVNDRLERKYTTHVRSLS